MVRIIVRMSSSNERKLKQGRLVFSTNDASQKKCGTSDSIQTIADNEQMCSSEIDKMKDLPVNSCLISENKLEEKENVKEAQVKEAICINLEEEGDIIMKVDAHCDEDKNIKSVESICDVTDSRNGKNKKKGRKRKKKPEDTPSRSSTSIESMFKRLKEEECSKPMRTDVIDLVESETKSSAVGSNLQNETYLPSPRRDFASKNPVTVKSSKNKKLDTSSDNGEVNCCVISESPQISSKSDISLVEQSSDNISEQDSTNDNENGDSSKKIDIKTPSRFCKAATKEELDHKKALFKKLTPKQMAREREKNFKKEHRDQLRKEKQEEKLKLTEEKAKRKQDETEAKLKEKEEKKQKKEDERLKREEERIKKEEEKLKKEEERLKKEEEKSLAEEEEKEKKEKVKAKFAQFFVPKKAEVSPPKPAMENFVTGAFMKFQVKDNMRIAPLCRRYLTDCRKVCMDEVLSCGFSRDSDTYLKELKKSEYVPGKSKKTYLPDDKKEDFCEIIDDDDENIDEGCAIMGAENIPNKTKVKPKFLQFCENRRPAYFGTWFKKSDLISGRHPFGKETSILDYDYDSDDDWEEEEAGESLSDSEGENEEGGDGEGDQYEVDNDFFVPHGYLSDDEGKDDNEEEEEEGEIEEGGKKEEESECKDESVEREKLKRKQAEFEIEMKQKTRQLKPKVYGCVWLGDKTCHLAFDQLVKILTSHHAINMTASPYPLSLNDTKSISGDINSIKDEDSEELQSAKRMGKSFPEKAVPDLIRLIHGNRNSKVFLVREFFEYWNNNNNNQKASVSENSTAGNTQVFDGSIPKRKIEMKIQELGSYGRYTEGGVTHKYRTWYVTKKTREMYNLEELSFQNSWVYAIPPKEWAHSESKPEKEDSPDIENDEQLKPKSAACLITRFTKVLTEEEKEEERKKSQEKEEERKKSQEKEEERKKSLLLTANDDVKEDPVIESPVLSKKAPPRSKRKRVSLISLPEDPEDASKPKSSKISSFFIKRNKEPHKGDHKCTNSSQKDCIILD